MDQLNDQARYPTLSEEGSKMLKFLKEHPNAPIFRNQSGNRLTAQDIEAVRDFEREVMQKSSSWEGRALPDWLSAFVQNCYERVPFYRALGDAPTEFTSIPTVARSNFQTTGVTGHPLLLPSHPVVSASYLVFLKKALLRHGVSLNHGRGQVGVLLLGYQRKCFTYASVTPNMGESGLVKINLHPNDWRNLEDRERYLDALEAEVFTGDPICYSELLKLPIRYSPKAMISTSMKLLPALKEKLEQRFGCLVLDLYSMNESGPIAVGEQSGHVILQNKLYVEILDPKGEPVPHGQRGEVTLSGGFNMYLPLLRYRTGDFASLAFVKGEPVLIGLEGRPPVRFMTSKAEWINNIDVSHALGSFALSQFKLHQEKSGKVLIWIRDENINLEDIKITLQSLFGQGIELGLESGVTIEDKVIQYTSELEGASPY